MRSLRVFGATTSVASLAAFLALSCAKANGEIVFGSPDGSVDAPKGIDVTYVAPDTGAHDAGKDATMGMDVFVAPTPDASPDTHVGPGKEAGFDGGLVFFGNPGTPCTTLGAKQLQACGLCGTQTSQCIVRPDGGVPFDAASDAAKLPDGGTDATLDAASESDGGGHDAAHGDAAKDAAKDASKDAGPDLVWGEWGTCTGQLAPDAGCLPGTQTTASCGICGTQTLICEADCEYGVTNCVGQIDGGCSPGSSTFTPNPACDGGFAGNQQVCSPTTCQLETPSVCVTPPTTITVSTAVGAKLTTFVDFTAANEKPLVADENTGFACPTTITSATLDPYGFITLVNPSTSTTATVSVWTSQVAGQPQIDTAIGAYATMPTNNAGLKNCSILPTDSCDDTTDPTSCLGSYGGLMLSDFDPVVIPAGGSVAIFVQDQFNDAADMGVISVTVRTESFP
jgi:hypothetical protein